MTCDFSNLKLAAADLKIDFIKYMPAVTVCVSAKHLAEFLKDHLAEIQNKRIAVVRDAVTKVFFDGTERKSSLYHGFS